MDAFQWFISALDCLTLYLSSPHYEKTTVSKQDEAELSEIDPETAKILTEGLSYEGLEEHLIGISLSIRGDMILFGIRQNTLEFIKDTVNRIRENEARVRGIPVEDVAKLPGETMLDKSSLKIWIDDLTEIDRSKRN